MVDDYSAIRAALERLRAAPAPPLFGANAHGFRIHPPLSEAELHAFESEHGVVLPPDYRGFLLQVGNGGAGLAYGLFKLGEMDAGFGHQVWIENNGFVGTLRLPFPHTAPWNDRTGMPSQDETRDDPEGEDEYDEALTAWEEQHYWHPRQVQGAIPICHRGCALRLWLVITGSEAGHVWCDDRADQGGLYPLTQGDAQRVSFLAWYRAWLDEALALLRL